MRRPIFTTLALSVAGAGVGYFQSQRSVSAFVGVTILPVDFWEAAPEQRKRSHQR